MGNPLPVNLSAECRKADKIIKDFVDPVNGLDRVIPLTVLRRAKGFAIFSIFRVGFVLTARAGSGVVIAKLPDGSWSAPSALGIGGIGGGFSAGAEVTDFIVVLNSRSAVKSFMATGSLQLGGNLSLAVGPLGRSAEASGALNSSGEVAAMFSYSKSQGLFGGVSLEGTALVDRSDANSKAYNRSITAKKILSGAVDVPAFAQGLIGTIERLSLTGRMSEAARADELEPGAGRDSWSMDDDRDPQDDDDDDLYARPRRAGRNSNNTSKQNDGLESYFSQAELDSRQRRYEREQLTGAAYNRAPPAIPSTSVIPRHSPSPPPASSSSQTTRDPFATSDDEQDPYSLDRDNATRNAGAYTFSSQSGGSLTNSPSATRGDGGGGTPGGGRKRSDSRASFKGAAAGYFDEYLNKDKRSYSPIDGKRPSVGHRKASSSFSIPKFGRKTPPAFGSAARPADSLISADPTDSFNERFRNDDDSADVNAATHNWNRDASPGPASPADAPAFGAPDYDERLSSRHRPPSSRKGSSSLFSFGGNNNNSSASASSAYGANGGLKKTTAADAIRAAAAGGGGVGGLGRGKVSGSTSNDAFSDIWDAERARASTQGSSSSYSNGLDSLDEELQRGGSLRRPAGGGGGGGAGYPTSTSFSDDVNGATPPTTTSRFSPISFFRTNSGGVKSAGSNATATGGGGRSGSGAGFRTNSGGGFRSGSGGGFRTSSRNSNSTNGGSGGGGGLSNFVGVGMARVGSNSGRNGGDRGKNGIGSGNSHLLGSSSEGEDDDRDGADAYHARRRHLHTHVQESSSGANSYDDGAQVSLSTNHDHIPPSASSHSQSQGGAAGGVADDWGLSHLSMNNSTSNPTTTSTTQRVVASFDFAGQEADDLRFNRGDVIVVLKKTASTNDWWLGRTADGRVGNFPANFVEGV